MCADRPDNDTPAYLWYKVAYDLNSDGSYSSLSSIKTAPAMGNYYQGADIDICDFNGNGIPDLILMVYDNPVEMNSFRYQIAYDLNSYGDYRSLSTRYEIPGFGHDGDGAGIAVGDIDKNGTLDIILWLLMLLRKVIDLYIGYFLM